MNEEKEVWELKNLFKGKTEKEILDKVLSIKERIVQKKDSLNNEIKPEEVLEFILLDEELDIEFSRVSSYYGLRFHVNIEDEEASAKLNYYKQLGAEIDNETMFFDLWFMSLSKEKSQEYIESPVLSKYKKHLQDLTKSKPHTKSEEIEQILNLKNITSNGFSNLYDVFTANFKYELLGKKGLTQEEITSKYSDSDPKIREEAYKSILSVYKENSTALSEVYNNIVLDWNNEKIKIRNYKDSIHPRNFANDLPNEAVKIIIQVIRENVHVFQEYFKLKKDFLEKKGKPHPYSRYHVYAPYDSGLKEYSYEESKKICLQTFKDFDEDFYEKAKKIFEEKHVHSHPEKNKRSGAFCSAPNNETTPYILLNHTNKTRDLFTMMHELGHGVHDLYTFEQPNLLHHPSLPLAETASILGETILKNELLKTDNEEEKASLLLYSLDQYYASILRQTYFVLFEEIAHQKIPRGITKKELDNTYYELLKEQFGDMEIPGLFKHEWNYIPHIHHTPFYCYAYSWGNLLVLALYAEYEKNHGFKENIKNILKKGSCKDTLTILKEEGIKPNKEFWEQGFKVIQEEIQQLKEIIKK